jgi:hypothetical protein
MERKFALAHVPREGSPGTRTANRIYCSGCTNQDVTGGAVLMNPTAARRCFERLGWEVGKRAKDDLCPQCVARRRAEQIDRPKLTLVPVQHTDRPKLTLVPVQHTDAEGVIHHDMELKDMSTTKAAAAPLPTRTMTIDDRRIVYEAVSDHYVDPKTGYEKGWTDKRIGEDLGVPWAWVKEVRCTLFGEKEGITEDVAELRKELAGTHEKLDALHTKLQETQKALNELTNEQMTLGGEFSKLRGSAVLLGQRIARLEG